MTFGVSPHWIDDFKRGDREAFRRCYETYFTVVDHAVGRILSDADRDAVVHDVFYKLMSRADIRRSYQGPNFGAWLRTMARNQALDFARARGRAVARDDAAAEEVEASTPGPEGSVVARQLVDKVLKRLPAQLMPVFGARFIDQLSQREAASSLGMPRTTLVAHEARIRKHIDKVLTEGES